jgi:FAD/FMN-containing dehydrogenase
VPHWSNWSGNVRASPARVEAPRTEDDVQRIVRAATRDGLIVRPAGSRHSFTPLCATDGLALDLHHLAGVESIDTETRCATVLGGTLISVLGAPLYAAGLALHNQGDVDTQTITGAIGTGTHGTGPTLRNLSSAVTAVRIVTADGELRRCSSSADGDLFEAARLSLGALGVVTAVTLQCTPAYNLHERVWFEGPDESLERLAERVAATRHYEFFWHPERDLFEHKALDPTDLPADPMPDAKRERIDTSARIFPSIREQRFNEMEYAVPVEAGPECFAAVRKLMRDVFTSTSWPVEYRTLAADDIWLSPAHQRDTVTISMHEDAALPYEPLFRESEAIFLAHDGRPHWGKVHGRRAADLATAYPEWGRFTAVRRAVDPDGTFLNPYLRDLLGA